MNAEQMESRAEELVKDQDIFVRNAYMLIEEMVELNNENSTDTSKFVDEILHSIFFLGKIKPIAYTPQDIVNDDEMYEALMEDYPRPFELYSTQLPRRSPLSCVLDMIVNLEGQENEDKIIRRLQQLIDQLREGSTNELVSSTICVSQNTRIPNSVRHYGVSMCTSGCNPGKIMVAASSFKTWHNYVAGAVMTYYPKKEKKSYFDGSIRLPEYVRCQTFSLSRGAIMLPCRSCGNLFGLATTEVKQWPYGNCAEAESVSNLLKNEEDVEVQSRPTSATYTDQNRQTAEDSVWRHLKEVLRMLKFEWDDEFYTPDF